MSLLRFFVNIVSGAIGHFGINIVLLYMFNSRVWLLNKEMMQNYIKEETEIARLENSNNINHIPAASTSKNLEVIVNEYKEKGSSSQQSVIRVINMYNLIKKQSILCFISVVTTVTWITWMATNKLAMLEFGWDMIVNMICTWMMLSTSKRYWHFCKDHGLCKCCYLNTGKNTGK